MATNLSRKQADAPFMQSKLQFFKKDKIQLVDFEMQTDPTDLNIECNIIEYNFPLFKKQENQLNESKPEVEKMQVEEEKNEIKEIYKCNECNIIFAYKHTLHRHFEKQHQENHSIYLKHEKINGRYACSTCDKTYSHSRDLKHHMQKMHQTDFQVQDLETNILIPAKRKSRFIESEKEQREKLKRQKLIEDMNKPATQTELILFQMKLIEIPSLGIIDQNDLIENYLSVATPHEPIVHSINNFAYKVYPLKYMVEKGTRALEFANEYAILKESKQRKNLNLLYLDGTIFNSYYVALRLPHYETTLRDYLRAVRDPSELPDILLQVIKGVKELHQMGFVHRDLKPDNIMINFNPIRVVVIDFNRAVRKENATLGTVLGTPGYFPIREKWLNGSIQWDIWSLAAIILECDLEKDEYFKTKSEEHAKGLARLHLSYDKVCEHLKNKVTKIIMKAPKWPNYSLEFLEKEVEQIKFQQLSTDKKMSNLCDIFVQIQTKNLPQNPKNPQDRWQPNKSKSQKPNQKGFTTQ